MHQASIGSLSRTAWLMVTWKLSLEYYSSGKAIEQVLLPTYALL